MKKIIAIVLIAVMVCSVLAGCTKKPENQGGGGVGLVVDPGQGDRRADETQKKWPNVACPGWGELVIPPDKSEGIDLGGEGFYNPIDNKGYYYLVFELRLPDSSAQGYEVLYKSGLVEPGKHIYNINLSRGLPAGEYEAILHVQPYKMDTAKTPTNNMDSKLTLKVINLG